MELKELRRIAAKEEMSLNFVAKDEMLSKALLSLQANDDLILKGGTAINRVYLDNKRFSEDLDFDLIFKGDAKKALSRTDEIVDAVKYFKVARPRIMNQTIRYDLSYINPLEHRDKIRLEFKPIDKAKGFLKKIVNFGFVPAKTSLHNVYDIDVLIGHKIECILNRQEAKDYFDLYYLLELPHKKIHLDKHSLDMDKNTVKRLSDILNPYIPGSRRMAFSMLLDELKLKL